MELTTPRPRDSDEFPDAAFATSLAWIHDHPEVGSLFTDPSIGPAELAALDKGTRQRAEIAAESFARVMTRELIHRDNGRPSGDLEAWINQTLKNSLFLREWLSSHVGWYVPSLNTLLPAAPAAG